MADIAERLYRELLDERGGEAALSLVQRVVVRRLAQELASDGPAATITGLMALLPPARTKPVEQVQVTFCSEPKWDLSKLDDLQLQMLAELAAIGTGTEKPPRSRRLDYALSLSRRLDAVESNGEIVVDERDRLEVQNDLMMMLSPLVPRKLFGITDIETELRQVRVELEQARKALEEAGRAPNGSRGTPGTSGVQSNVVPFSPACTVRQSNVDLLGSMLSHGNQSVGIGDIGPTGY